MTRNRRQPASDRLDDAVDEELRQRRARIGALQLVFAGLLALTAGRLRSSFWLTDHGLSRWDATSIALR